MPIVTDPILDPTRSQVLQSHERRWRDSAAMRTPALACDLDTVRKSSWIVESPRDDPF
jgi:hypothetical protein